MSDEIPLSADSLKSAMRDIRAECGLEPIDPIDWDGFSPIEGESVTRDVDFAGARYVFTATKMYRVKGRGDSKP